MKNWQVVGKALWSQYGIIFVGAYLLTYAVYSYLFTAIIFTDHTLPNVWVYPYPSFKTRQEGRWFADIIIQVFGGSGVPSFQMIVAVGIQIINAFLFAKLINIRQSSRLFLIAAFLSLHPAFLDYYCFSIDHISFALGDSLALVGVLALDRISDRRAGLALASFCFVLTLATYGPKIALIGTLLLSWCMLRPDVDRVLTALSVFLAGLVVYYITVKLTVTAGETYRNHINSLGEVAHQLVVAYPETIKDFTSRVDYLPRLLSFLPSAAIVLGLAGLIVKTWRDGGTTTALISTALMLGFPVALRLSYLVDDQTWQNSGRILTPHAYFLLFTLASMWSMQLARRLGSCVVAVLVYYFAVLGTEEANAAVIKNTFEVSKINRIVMRVEDIAPDIYEHKFPIVIIGAMKFQPEASLIRFSNSLYGSQFSKETFAPYRQVGILNYFLGQREVVPPDQSQIDSVETGAAGRRPWPAPDSVYLQDGVIVVLLEPYRPDAPITWAR